MTINLTTLFGINTAKSAVNTKAVNFKSGEKISTFNFEDIEQHKDGFVINPLGVTTNKAEIERLAKSPKIQAILNEYNLPLRVNMDALEEMI